jgi:hypothetical protein
MAANKRKFDGKVYLLVDSGYPNRLKAKSAANQERQDGYNVRIIKDSDGRYSIYRHHSQHFISGMRHSGITSTRRSIRR